MSRDQEKVALSVVERWFFGAIEESRCSEYRMCYFQLTVEKFFHFKKKKGVPGISLRMMMIAVDLIKLRKES